VNLGFDDRVAILLQAGRAAEAWTLLQQAVAACQPEALALAAQWRIAGNVVRRDLAVARDLLGRAGEAGHAYAALLHCYFLAAGVGGPADWPGAVAGLRALARGDAEAAGQLRLLASMALDEDGRPAAPPALERISEKPSVSVARGFMTPDECAWLIGRAKPRLSPSVVVDPQSGRMMAHPVRRSDFASFGVFDEDLVVNALNRRIATLTSTRADQGEPLQVLSYAPGGEYRAHFDALPATDNQRALTLLVYLNDDYTGGETAFLHSGLSVKGEKGMALLFRNADAAGRPDPAAQHAGRPVRSGTKLIASRWIRARRFDYPPPTPLLNV
jgi:prolyl 4-hydroxylase